VAGFFGGLFFLATGGLFAFFTGAAVPALSPLRGLFAAAIFASCRVFPILTDSALPAAFGADSGYHHVHVITFPSSPVSQEVGHGSSAP
jgi:hypothetical protein